MFDDPKNAKEVDVGLIQGSPYANWREATPFHYWGMVDYFDPLTLDDARVAVGGTRDALVEVLSQHYLPIADRHLTGAG